LVFAIIGTTFLFDELVTRHPGIKAQIVRRSRKLKVRTVLLWAVIRAVP
jgi:hypothetical protein